MKIKYEYDSSYRVKSKILLRWDFIIITTGEPLFIEYDGRQHFEPVNFGGISDERAKKAFELCKAHDKIKNDFCNNNGYLLLRIKYTDYENIESLVVKFIRDNTDWGYG
jgi:very-short-patch-repair endonuclease